MIENPYHQSRLGINVKQQLDFARASRKRFFPFVFEAPIYDGHDIMVGLQKTPLDFDQRHGFSWRFREQMLGVQMICNREYLDHKYVEENTEILHLSVTFFGGNRPIHTSRITWEAGIEIPVLIIPKVTWSLKMSSDWVFHFFCLVDDAKMEICRRMSRSNKSGVRER